MTAFAPPTRAEWPAVLALLRASGLPTRDLADADAERFVVVTDHGVVVGCVAVERYGDAGLLRSLAVDAGRRGEGWGRALVTAAEDVAGGLGLGVLYLLTTTAAPFFEAHGFTSIEREAVPEAVRQSSEFRDVCPASATCLAKSLAP